MNRILKRLFLLVLCFTIVFSGCGDTENKEREQAQIRQRNMRSIVDIYTEYPDSKSSATYNSFGSGIILEKNQNGDVYVATNLHVVSGGLKEDGEYEEGCSTIVSFNGGGKENGVSASLIGFYKNFDIAVLFVKDFAKKFSIVCPIEKTIVKPIATERIRVFGNALGKGLSVTEGVVSVDSEYLSMSVSYQQTPITLRQIRVDAPMNQGCSGGGVFNLNGEFIGMVNARSGKDGVDDFGYVIPSATVIPLCQKIIDGYNQNDLQTEIFDLGVNVTETNPVFTWIDKEDRIETSYSVVVSSVKVGTIGSVFLQNGDVIDSVTLNDKEFSFTREFDLDNISYLVKIGDNLTFKYKRSGVSMEYSFAVDQAYMVNN